MERNAVQTVSRAVRVDEGKGRQSGEQRLHRRKVCSKPEC